MSNTINQQTPVTPQLADLIAIWATANGRTANTSLTELLTLIQNNITLPGATEATTQYSAPSATGFTVVVNDNNLDTHLILTPGAAYATGAITLPTNTNLRDKQIFMMNTTEQITALTINLNGAAGAHGIPSAMGADDYMTLKYDETMNTWYRVG